MIIPRDDIYRGFSIDFVNLRTEKYTSESRIPHVDIGSPREV